MLALIAQDTGGPLARHGTALALLTLLVVSLLLLIIVLVAARAVRRSASRGASRERPRDRQSPVDPWSESARRLEVEPEGGEDRDETDGGHPGPPR